MISRKSYTPSQLSHFYIESNLHLGALKENGWFVNSEKKPADFINNIASGKLKVLGHKFEPKPASPQSQIRTSFYSAIEIRKTDSAVKQFLFDQGFTQSEVLSMQKAWDTAVDHLFSTASFSPALSSTSSTTTTSSSTTLVKDASGEISVETVFSDVTIHSGKRETPIKVPGQIRTKFKLAKKSFGGEKEFKLTNMTFSNDFLSDLCFNPQVSANRKDLEARATQAQHIENYADAVDVLQTTLKNTGYNATLRQQAKTALDNILAVEKKANFDFELMGNIVRDTEALIKDPTLNLERFTNHVLQVESKRSWGKIVAGSLLLLAGIALIGMSLGVGILTLGGAAPISAIGAAFGVSVVVAAVGVIGIGVVGAVSVAGGSYSLFKGLQPQPVTALHGFKKAVLNERENQARAHR